MNGFNFGMIVLFWLMTLLDHLTSGGKEQKSWFGKRFSGDEFGMYSPKKYWRNNLIGFAVGLIPIFCYPYWYKVEYNHGGAVLLAFAFAHGVTAFGNKFLHKRLK